MATLYLRCGTGVSSFVIHSYSSSSYPKTVTSTSYTAYTGFAANSSDAYISDVVYKSGYSKATIYSSTTGTEWSVSSDPYISLATYSTRYAEVRASGGSTTYSVKCSAGTGISSFTFLKNTTSGTGTTAVSVTANVNSSSGYLYLKGFSFESGYGYPVTVTCSNPSNTWTISSSTTGDRYISPPSSGGTRTATLTATKSQPETYKIHFNASTGISSFTYTLNGGSTVHTATTPTTIDFGTTKGYITLKSITLSTGYGYPVTATADVGTTSWTIQTSSSGFVDATISCVDVTGTTSNIRNVTMNAVKITAHTLHVYFDDIVQSITFTNGDTITYDSRAQYQIYTYYEDLLISHRETSWKAGWSNFTGHVYWGTSSGAKTHDIGSYVMGNWDEPGTVSDRTIAYTSTTPRNIYISGSGITYYTIKMNPNGGTVNGHTSEYTVSAAYEGGTTYILPTASQVIAPEGYELHGFRKGSPTTGTYYPPGGSVTIDGNYTFYAVWLAIQYDYKLYFDPNGGHFSDWSTDPKVYEVITTRTTVDDIKIISSYIPIKTGNTFLGYGWSKTQTSNLYVENDYVTLTSSNPVRTLYAIWKMSIDEFNWTSSDNTNIVTGKPVTNILASKWNLLREIIEAISGTKPGTDVVSQVTPMTKTIFNVVRNAIAALPGASSVPNTVDKGDVIEAELFHTTKTLGSSLKKAINKAIEYYNTH